MVKEYKGGRKRKIGMEKVNRSAGVYYGNEMPERPRRPRHTTSQKLRILEELDGCASQYGAASALARREGVYPSTLKQWQVWRERMRAKETPDRRPKAEKSLADVSRELNEALGRIVKLEMELKKANGLLEVQKKTAFRIQERLQSVRRGGRN